MHVWKDGLCTQTCSWLPPLKPEERLVVLSWGEVPLMCPPPQIASLPAPKKEQRDPPEHPGSGSYRLIRWGVEDVAEGCGEHRREQGPHRAQRYGHAGEVGGSSVCARLERGS